MPVHGSNSYDAAVAYIAIEDIVLGHGCISVFILIPIVQL
jgi:hypothetical protein